MNEIVERVAAILWDAEYEDCAPGPLTNMPPATRAHYAATARAAIAGLREPTEEMVRAGHGAWDREAMPGPFTIEKIWRAMLDAALTEPADE